MRRQITAMALSLAMCGSLLSATALAAETPSGAADAAMAAAGVKDGQTVTQKELYAADPEGTVSFANLEARVRENNLTIRMLEESIASIDVVDYEKMYDELKDGLNEIAKIQRTMLQLGQLDSAMGNTSLSGSFSSEYIFSNLDASYDSLRETFDDLKDGKIQDDYAAAKRQLENAENQVVMGAETLYMAILEMQNTRASLQRQLDALDRTVEEMELRYKLGQISALTLQQVKNGRTQLASGIATLDMNIRNYTRQLEVMLGLEQTGSLTLTEPPQVSDKQVAEMDYDTALAAAKEKSYDLFAAQRTLDDAEETYKDSIKGYGQNNYHYKSAVHTYEAAKYTYQSTVQSFEMNFRTMYDAVADYQQVLKASQSALDYQKNACAASQLKYQQGTISKNSLLEAQDSLASAEADVATAKHNLFSAYHTYLWAVEYGILN
ncbi:MAG: TolC family protein [Clostridiales bacterium]|nr:TolC family protein [Clostridiales bacterium]